MNRDEALAQLDYVKQLRDQAAAARQFATGATEPAIVDALKAGIGPAEIAARTGVSDSHVRAVRREHDLPANPSYAHLNPAANKGADLTAGLEDLGTATIRASAALDQLHATVRDEA